MSAQPEPVRKRAIEEPNTAQKRAPNVKITIRGRGKGPATPSIDAAIAREKARLAAERAKLLAKPKAPAAKAPVTVVGPGRGVVGGSRNLPDAESGGAPKGRDPLAGVTFASAIGASRKSAPARTVTFERASTPPDDLLWQSALGVRRKAPAITIAYARSDTPENIIERFAAAGAHECRREARQGRKVLQGVLSALNKGDILLLAQLGDLSRPEALPYTASAIQERGVHIVSLDGVDTRTPEGRGKLAHKIVALRAAFESLAF